MNYERLSLIVDGLVEGGFSIKEAKSTIIAAAIRYGDSRAADAIRYTSQILTDRAIRVEED